MNNLNKLELILNTVSDHNITAYEIGKHTNISTFAIQKILNRETSKPNERTLNEILLFLEKAIIGTDYKENIVEEPKEVYQKNPENQKTQNETYLLQIVELHKHINYLETLLLFNKIIYIPLSEKEKK